MLGATLPCPGDQANARRILEGTISRHVATARLRPNANLALSRILWRQGVPRPWPSPGATSKTRGRPISQRRCATRWRSHLWSLSGAAIWPQRALGDGAARLVGTSRVVVWHRPARYYDGVRLIKRGEADEKLERLRTALDEIRMISFVPYHPVTRGTLAVGWPPRDMSLRP
jgi:hypothetical protein